MEKFKVKISKENALNNLKKPLNYSNCQGEAKGNFAPLEMALLVTQQSFFEASRLGSAINSEHKYIFEL